MDYLTVLKRVVLREKDRAISDTAGWISVKELRFKSNAGGGT